MDRNLIKPLVSIVIPVYNVEKYIKRCIQSVVAQTYKNYQVILVDDGSTDKSGIICDEYSKNFSNILVLHQKNQGLSMARNSGVRIARGEFISFIDSDDYVSADYIEKLVKAIIKYSADIAVIGSVHISEKKDIPIEYRDKTRGVNVYSTTDALREMLYGYHFGVSAWAKLYRKEILLLHPYPKGVLYEDLATTYRIIGEAKYVVYVNSIGYFYVTRDGSIVRSEWNRQHLYGLVAAKAQLRYIKRNYPQCVNGAKYMYIVKIIDYMNLLRGNTSNEEHIFKKLQRLMLPFYKTVLYDPHVSGITKIRMGAIKMGYMPMLLVWKLADIIRRK